ncbi:Uncharacterised protein [uncultured archaeon]|nr:Uncharacterised protein [uncultured archaeon]
MDLRGILVAIFLAMTVIDSFFFYLGKRGILEYLRSRKWGKKIYNLAHRRAKRLVHRQSSIAVIIAKLTWGGTILAMMYLGEHIKFRKFIFIELAINLIFCGIIWILVGFFSFSLASVLETISGIQKEILLVVISIIFFILVDRFFDRKLSKLFIRKKN